MEIDVREYLGDLAKSRTILDNFLKHEVTVAANDGMSGYALQAYEMLLRRFYHSSLEIIFRHSGSPIETIFLVSLLFSFLRAEPCGVIIRAPQPDFPEFVARSQAYYRAVDETARGIKDETSGERTIKDYIDHLVASGLMSTEEASFHASNYMVEHQLGYANAFHVTMQAGFPEIRVGKRGIRVDLAIWVPSTPSCRIVVECDGFAHHRSKAKFTSDRKRDRLLQAAGYQTFRFSGTEIWHDPAAAGRELFLHLESLERPGA